MICNTSEMSNSSNQTDVCMTDAPASKSGSEQFTFSKVDLNTMITFLEEQDETKKLEQLQNMRNAAETAEKTPVCSKKMWQTDMQFQNQAVAMVKEADNYIKSIANSFRSIGVGMFSPQSNAQPEARCSSVSSVSSVATSPSSSGTLFARVQGMATPPHKAVAKTGGKLSPKKVNVSRRRYLLRKTNTEYVSIKGSDL